METRFQARVVSCICYIITNFFSYVDILGWLYLGMVFIEEGKVYIWGVAFGMASENAASRWLVFFM